MSAVRNYVLVTRAYWAFTLTDGALRMLVLLHFDELGYTPVELAFLFLFYEFFGVVTNLLGGWIAARTGLRVTLLGGLGAAGRRAGHARPGRIPPGASRVSVAYVMAAQSLSGIAKDLTKMSAKSAIKVLVPADADGALSLGRAPHRLEERAQGRRLLPRRPAARGPRLLLVSRRDGRGARRRARGHRPRPASHARQDEDEGQVPRAPFEDARRQRAVGRAVLPLRRARHLVRRRRAGLPVRSLGWGFTGVGSFLALWVIGYGVVQSLAPALIRRWTGGNAPGSQAAQILAFLLAAVTVAIALGLTPGGPPAAIILGGLALFGVVFAVSSSVHSYLILAYSDGDRVAMNVGFYYMANAGGRLVGTLLSGLLFQLGGVDACLWGSAAFAAVTGGISLLLPLAARPKSMDGMKVEGAD